MFSQRQTKLIEGRKEDSEGSVNWLSCTCSYYCHYASNLLSFGKIYVAQVRQVLTELWVGLGVFYFAFFFCYKFAYRTSWVFVVDDPLSTCRLGSHAVPKILSQPVRLALKSVLE